MRKFYSLRTHSAALRGKRSFQLLKSAAVSLACLGRVSLSLGDLGQEQHTSLFQEGELVRRKVRDIWPVLSKDLPGIHVILLVVERADKVAETINRSLGVLGYIREYWAGFFPLLLVDLGDPQVALDEKALARLRALFSTVHRY